MITNPAPTINGYPSPFIDPKEKLKDSYGIQYARAILWESQSKNSGYDERLSKFILNAKYAAGKQSIDKFKQSAISKDGSSNPANVGDTSYLNIDRSVVQIIPKFVDILIGRMMDRDWKPRATAINPSAKMIQDDYRKHLMVNMMLKEKSDEMEQKTGIPIIPQGEYVPKDQDELETHLQVDFRVNECMIMEEELSYIMKENRWKVIERKIKKDLIVNKIGAFRTFYDKDYNIRAEYLDPNPAKLIIPYSDDQEFEKMAHAGYRHKILLSDLAQSAPQFTDEDLYNIASKSQGMNGNIWDGAWGNTYSMYYQKFGLTRNWNNFMIDVMYFEFISTDVKKWTVTNKNGKSYLDKKNADYVIPEGTKNEKELIERSVKNRYEGYWVVNTDYIYDYGLSKNIPRKLTISEKGKRLYSPDTTLSFKIVAPGILDMVNSSLVDRMIKFADNIYIIDTKMQQIVSGIKNSGVAIDISGLEAISLGMGQAQIDPTQITEMYNQLGSFIFSSTRPDGSIINGKPIEQILNSEGNKIEELIRAYEWNLNQIRNVTGINENADASTVKPNTLVGTAKMAVEQSAMVTRELEEWFQDLMNRGLRDMALMVQDCVENGRKLQAWANVIGEEAVNIMQQNKSFYFMEMGIDIELLPSEQEVAELMELMKFDIQSGKLNSLDAFMIKEQAKSNIKHAALLMAMKEKQFAKQKMEEAAQNSQLQSESAIQASQAKTQGDAETIKNETMAKEYLLNLELKNNLIRDEALHNSKMKEIELMNQGKIVNTQVAADGKMLVNDLVHDHNEKMATKEKSKETAA